MDGNVAAENPQLVLPQRAADRVAGLDDGLLVLVRHVILRRTRVAVRGRRDSGEGRLGFGAQTAIAVVRIERVAAQVGQQRTVPVVGALLAEPR